MRKTTILGLLVAGAVAVACGSTDGNNSGGSSGSSTGSGDGAGDKPAAKTAKIGDAVRDGKFEFTVKQIKCGVAKVGTNMLGEKAQGQFCLVTINVKNIGKEAQTFSDSSQTAYGADGAEYSADTAAALYANKDADTFLNQINPGNQITGVVVFDIPKTAKLAKLELHDSPFSGGITVTLT